MSEHDEIPEQPYELVMPFVVTTSHGGPYEDNAFVAGWQCAEVDRELAWGQTIKADLMRKTVFTGVLPQIELIAMKHGYTATFGCDDESEWAAVLFRLTNDYPYTTE